MAASPAGGRSKWVYLLGLLPLGGCNQILGNSEPGVASSGGAPASSGGADVGGSGGTGGSGGMLGSGGSAATGGATGSACASPCSDGQGCLNGACVPILPECLGKAAGTTVCSEDGARSFACGTNLVVAEQEEDCEHWCSQGACATLPSCTGLATTCGANQSDSCCSSLVVTGGDFYRGTDTSYPATISDFRLDKYEVTVGRFRLFVTAVVGGVLPSAGSGKHTHLRGGLGLVGTTGEDESGWNAAWNAGGTTYRLFTGAGTKDDWDESLRCSSDFSTWTPSADLNEALPINCLNWYQAAAFCIWDGGFLPSEAEWEFAAAGGGAERIYPWGSPEPDVDRAVFACTADGSEVDDCAFSDILAVGSKPDGDGFFGHSDLGGSLWDWTLDWYVAPYATPGCDDCTNTTEATERVARGGSWATGPESLTAVRRTWRAPADGSEYYGVRCARAP